MSNKAKRHMQQVSEIPCLICEHMGMMPRNSEVHHVFDTAARSDWLTVALCREHHQGATGFHGLGQREFERRYHITEAGLLAMTLERLA